MILKRTDLFNYFVCENPELPKRTHMMIFAGMSDDDLARMFHLNVLRKGYFYGRT